jgi:hypothetical protein
MLLFLESCYLLFANRAYILELQNLPSVIIRIAQSGLNNSVAVDFDKRYEREVYTQ